MNTDSTTGMRHSPLNEGWQFRRLTAVKSAAGEPVVVDLPHSPFVADLQGNEPWFGVCLYSRSIPVPELVEGARLALHVGAAMQTARVLVDGVEAGKNVGGYLPFEIDLTPLVRGKLTAEIALELDNRHQDTVPPGKPYEELDFCWYGGLHQEVELRIYPPVFLTSYIREGETPGGIFIRTESVAQGDATLVLCAEVENMATVEEGVRLDWIVIDQNGDEVACDTSNAFRVATAARHAVSQRLVVPAAKLWSPQTPHRHTLTVVVRRVSDGSELDRRSIDFGIRLIGFSRSGGFEINGRSLRLRGVNRHQDFPRVGYAASRAAQYREARRIKEAGFDYVRLSHYPQSPHFMTACDEYGLVVANCIPGWQFFGCEAFQENCADFARRLVRRDRNHPCVVLWELSLNETQMTADFMRRMHEIGHEEYPGDQMFTCGWMDGFDVFFHSRQHGAIHTWRNDDKALVVAEYGDWEYYAANEGFDQKAGTGILDRRLNSRKFRGDGEAALWQQARNHVEALNDTLSSPAVLDGLWAMNDYPRGYEQTRAACGIMDFFRLPKFSFYFYRSQRDAAEVGVNWSVGPMVFAATYWQEQLPGRRLWVFSNCETVELLINDQVVAPATTPAHAQWLHLPHPPFVFEAIDYVPGALEAVGRMGGGIVARHRVMTPGTPTHLVVWSDEREIVRQPHESDLLLVYAGLHDDAGSLCVETVDTITFTVTGGAHVVGPVVVETEAGIAAVAVHVPIGVTHFEVSAQSASAPAVRSGRLAAIPPAVLAGGQS
ncbi:glycoside hydrolase family 2 protein [Synoicihabitans lomoniglobus]|uniref:Glycoside hydrolase family 2 TIM barrel-domain containing protein n=1 Tax=Synoicihabitans lomoniglobus TaxID=2909285 RepID=A0AAF0A1U2_9BACT|nr:glycoside hydrolase family 2 protein [Opitutaceae bacterium LMO-M01]WED65347.1 glycoside hydrolase family 2 TIM barrel-domain containing protein [Opitutaceae bacterium LMO-M01]